MKKYLLPLLIILFINNYLLAQDSKFQAIFLYNFTRQLGWPDDYKTGDIVIKVLGESTVVDEINAFAKDNPVNGQNVVSQTASAANIGKCHILFIPASKSGELAAILTKVGTTSTLIVTEQADLTTKGAGVSFVKSKEKDGEILKYQFNVANITKHNIKVSSNFTSLGIAQ